MDSPFCRPKMRYWTENAEARDTAFHRKESGTRQPVVEADANDLATIDACHRNAVARSYSCRLELGQYGVASTTSTQSYVATIGASTVQLLAEDAALRQTDNLEAFAATAVVEPSEGGAANSDRRRLGRIDNISPTLIPLLRSNAVARRIFEDNFENDLGPAISVIAALDLSVFGNDGVLLAYTPKPSGDILRTRVSEDLLNATRAHDRGILRRVSVLASEPVVLTYHKLDGYPIFITHAVETDAILEPWRQTLLHDSGLFAMVDAGRVLLALLVNSRARREETALAIRTEELAVESRQRLMAEAELEDVLRNTVERQEADRSRIARDLHDGLGQHVATLHFGLDDINRSADNPVGVREKAQRLQGVATEMSHEIGRIAWELRPVALDDLGLQTAIQTLVETVAAHSDLTFDLHITLGDRRLDSAKEIAFYRVVQEGMANIVKHADATRVGLSLAVTANEVRLVIEDNGRGFDWDESTLPRKRGGGSGLLGIRERLALVGGTLEIETAVGQGTALLIRVPV